MARPTESVGQTDVTVLEEQPLLAIRGLSKRFSGTQALSDVSMDVRRGEVHALLGENGAGKSTLIKILAGVHAADEGTIRLDGRLARPTTHGLPGVAFIHQDLGLVDSMSVMENIGHVAGFPRRLRFISWSRLYRVAEHILAAMQADIDPKEPVAQLSQAQKSIVAIARAISAPDTKLLVLDEPTASLAEADVARLFRTLSTLKGQHVGIIYVTHRLEEVFRIADRVTILRDGRHALTTSTSIITRAQLVEAIIGRPPTDLFVRSSVLPMHASGTAVVAFDSVVTGDVGPCSFAVHPGEIVALAGLQGAGQSRFGRLLVGHADLQHGHIRLKGRAYEKPSAAQAMSVGVGFISSKRIEESIAVRQNIRENLFANPSIPNRPKRVRWIAGAAERRDANALIDHYRVRAMNSEVALATLSGGNQQKVVLARWLSASRDLLVLEEPTMGVDIGAKADIYRFLRESLHRGSAVLLISSDFEEVVGIATRALVFHRGQIVRELGGSTLTDEALTSAALGDVT